MRSFVAVAVFFLMACSSLSAQSVNNPQEKQEALNRALETFLVIEKESPQEALQISFLTQIGDLFFQLEQYPWAMLYYQKAKKIDHRNPMIASLIQQTASQLYLDPIRVRPEQNDSWIHRGFTLFSISEWLIVSFFFLIAAAIFYSMFIWTKNQSYLSFGHYPFVLSLLLFSIISLFYYFSPIEAVMIEASSYYESPNELATKVKDSPLLPGESVEVIATLENGTWLQIRAYDGTIAFVPHRKIRLL